MRTIAASVALACFAASAAAQTSPPPAPPAAAAAPIAAPESCTDLATAPPLPTGASATMAQMTAADEAFRIWRRQGVAALECRRQQYNAVIDAMNAANAAWNTQIDAYCGRRNVRCERIQRADEPAPPTATPAP